METQHKAMHNAGPTVPVFGSSIMPGIEPDETSPQVSSSAEAQKDHQYGGNAWKLYELGKNSEDEKMQTMARIAGARKTM